ncbi:hypothetical protein Dsin_022950 [Dipteronia sinensis]|uniref:F-box domain-containing protein n=1 Tax=Dipteronia sinensis TaxID=43782 RepID=A0AAE0A313_9ROSI|nr:hypothetical protein Dsin_022950 [Dipteronia sinensis]
MAVTVRNPKILRTSSGGDDDGDRLSSLPEPIIHYIFSFLKTIDVFRASAVSRKWRYLWVSMPYLNFDIHAIWSKPQERWPLDAIIGRFKDFVNWVLMFQNSSIDIQTFRLRCLNFSDDDHTLQRWITVTTRRNLKQLHLKLLRQNHTPIRLPHCLVTCGSLVELKLEFEDQRCVVELPIYPGFSSLKCLDLHMIEFLDSNLLKNFISSCPVLESLKMESCLFGDFKILEIFSTSLKNLILDTGDFSNPNCDGLANCEIKVACPSLVSFYFLTASTWNFTFQDLNSLQAGFISYYFLPKHATAEECHYVMSKILKGLHNVQVLKLSVGFLRFLKRAVAKPKWFSTSFYNLKSLSLYVLLNRYKQVEPIINLLNLSPNLEAITILIDWMDLSECWEIPDEVTCSTYHLKSVRLLDFGGSENEVELVRFLLMKGQVLEKLSITWLEGVENRWEIIREIKKFPTCSSNIAFTFFNPRSNVCYGARFSDYVVDW